MGVKSYLLLLISAEDDIWDEDIDLFDNVGFAIDLDLIDVYVH